MNFQKEIMQKIIDENNLTPIEAVEVITKLTTSMVFMRDRVKDAKHSIDSPTLFNLQLSSPEKWCVSVIHIHEGCPQEGFSVDVFDNKIDAVEEYDKLNDEMLQTHTERGGRGKIEIISSGDDDLLDDLFK